MSYIVARSVFSVESKFLSHLVKYVVDHSLEFEGVVRFGQVGRREHTLELENKRFLQCIRLFHYKKK